MVINVTLRQYGIQEGSACESYASPSQEDQGRTACETGWNMDWH
jgi:hypothetical protein